MLAIANLSETTPAVRPPGATKAPKHIQVLFDMLVLSLHDNGVKLGCRALHMRHKVLYGFRIYGQC